MGLQTCFVSLLNPLEKHCYRTDYIGVGRVYLNLNDFFQLATKNTPDDIDTRDRHGSFLRFPPPIKLTATI
jgi:hypothetical protein